MTSDSQIGKNVRLLRGDMSQDHLARKMCEAGFSYFKQGVVSRTETGRRPLRLAEALAMAEILDVAPITLLHGESESDAANRMAMQELNSARNALDSAQARYEAAFQRTLDLVDSGSGFVKSLERT